jgi:hypothetical protein
MKNKQSVSVVLMVFRQEVLVVACVYKFSYLQIPKEKAHLLQFGSACAVYRSPLSHTVIVYDICVHYFSFIK